MGYRHSKEEILEGAIAAVFDGGLNRLTFGSLAKRLGISDRIIVYYFPSKDDLIGEVLAAIGARLQVALNPALTSQVPDHVAFVQAVWPTLARRDVDSVFAVFFEASGLATARIEPYRTMAPALVEGWIAWAESLIDGTPAFRRTEAAAAVAVLDGLLLMRQLAGPAAADRGVKGISGRRTRGR